MRCFYIFVCMSDDKDAIDAMTSRLFCAVKFGTISEASNLIDSHRLSSSAELLNAKDDTGRTPLYYAIHKSRSKLVKLLLDCGADNVKEDPELLNLAVQNESLKVVNLLLQHGADTNATDVNGLTALLAVFEGPNVRFSRDYKIKRNKMVEVLLSSGADINARTPVGYNALHIAAQRGLVKVVETLLEHKADVNSRTKHGGKTALHIACGEGHEKIVEMLLICGAKVDSRTEWLMTPLHYAAEVPYPRVIHVLLQFGAGIDFQDKYGRTALHFAVSEGCTKNVITLLQHGCDVNIQSKYLGTPLYLVTNRSIFPNREYYRGRYSRRRVINILQRHIVKMDTANLYVNKIDLLSIGSNNAPRLQNKCKQEIARLKSEKKINRTIVSFYDILTHNINRLAVYARNEKIAQALTSEDFKVKFPIYAYMIEGNLRRGKMRNELQEASYNCFPELTSVCTENIYLNLTDVDLIVLVETFKKQNLDAD